MKILYLILILLFPLQSWSEEVNKIGLITLTGEKNVKVVKTQLVEDLRTNKLISVRQMIEKLGDPITFAEFGGFDMCFAYKGVGETLYLFSVVPNGSTQGENFLDTHNVSSIILWINPTSVDDTLTVWTTKNIEGKSKISK